MNCNAISSRTKKTIFSISYILIVIVLIAVLYSQNVLDFKDHKINEPQIDENYGTTTKEIPEIIMPAALEQLWNEFCANNYETYPIGFIKNIKLNDSKQGKIIQIISTITGMDKNVILKAKEQSLNSSSNTVPNIKNNINYSDFKDLMQQIDDILGGGSNYNKDSLIGFGIVPISYEEALHQYNLAVNEDKITDGYARLFSDYAVAMVLSILPVFLAIIMFIKDRKANMSEIIYTKNISAAKIIITRYFAIITAIMIPVIILSYISNASIWGLYSNIRLDYLAPLKYDFGWIMPSVIIAVAVGICLTTLTNTPIAVVVLGFWWLLDINIGIKSVQSAYSLFRLIPRHNASATSYFRTQDYINHFNSLIGIGILTPIFQPEQHSDINDLVSSKYINTTNIYIIRTIYSIIFLTIFIILFSAYMYIRHCDITLWLIIETLSDAIFLGSLGMIASSICNNTIIAYMIPTVFYALNYGMGSKLKNFYLFSMTMGQFTPKMWMLATGILLIITAILLKEIQKKFR